MSKDESPAEMAARHVREGQARVARQEQLLAEMERDGHDHAALLARQVMSTLRDTLTVAHEHLRIEQEREDPSLLHFNQGTAP